MNIFSQKNFSRHPEEGLLGHIDTSYDTSQNAHSIVKYMVFEIYFNQLDFNEGDTYNYNFSKKLQQVKKRAVFIRNKDTEKGRCPNFFTILQRLTLPRALCEEIESGIFYLDINNTYFLSLHLLSLSKPGIIQSFLWRL